MDACWETYMNNKQLSVEPADSVSQFVPIRLH